MQRVHQNWREALASVAQLVWHLMHQKVASSIHWSGYMPRLPAWSPVGGVHEAADQCFALTWMFCCLLSFFSKNKFKKKKTEKERVLHSGTQTEFSILISKAATTWLNNRTNSIWLILPYSPEQSSLKTSLFLVSKSKTCRSCSSWEIPSGLKIGNPDHREGNGMWQFIPRYHTSHFFS